MCACPLLPVNLLATGLERNRANMTDSNVSSVWKTQTTDTSTPAGCFPVFGSPGLFNCPADVLPESSALLSGSKIPAGAASQISNYRVSQYDAVAASYVLGGVNYWWREEYVQFKNLTAENLAAFRQNYISDDSDSLDWPALDDLIAHSHTKIRSGSNAEDASATELQERFARLDTRIELPPCAVDIIKVIIDVVTLFFGGRELIRHRAMAQLQEFFIHSRVPLRDASRCLNVLHFGNEVPYFTKAAAILRLLKFVYGGGVSTIIYGVWSIIVKNLSWKDLVLYGVEIGSEWVAFFATDGVAAIAMIVQALGRGTWLALDLTSMAQCLAGLSSSTPNGIRTNDYFGLCVMAIDFPKPWPGGGYLQKSDPSHPDYFTYCNTLLIITDDPTGTRFLAVAGGGYIMIGSNVLTFAFQPTGSSSGSGVIDGAEVLMYGRYQAHDPVGALTRKVIQNQGSAVPQRFEQIDPGNRDVYHFKIIKVNRAATSNDQVNDQDQILLLSIAESANGINMYLGIAYNAAYPNRYYVAPTTNPQVWTVFKTPFNP